MILSDNPLTIDPMLLNAITVQQTNKEDTIAATCMGLFADRGRIASEGRPQALTMAPAGSTITA